MSLFVNQAVDELRLRGRRSLLRDRRGDSLTVSHDSGARGHAPSPLNRPYSAILIAGSFEREECRDV
jgi:hypothetical protein